ncbi:hypothetical protein GCM10023171_16980 [Microbacterium panaciterrae]|uniref:Uncharacterized protein n=1 Tax=Microbacterium panaciterrae TaxID=985759 RepID=A0ABP8PD30_9MICO
MWIIVGWLVVAVTAIASRLAIVWLSTAIAGVLIVLPVYVIVYARGIRHQRNAEIEAAEHLALPPGSRVPRVMLRSGPDSVRRFAENINSERRVSQGPLNGLRAKREAVPSGAWPRSQAGAVLLVAGVVLSLGAAVTAILNAALSIGPSPLPLMGLAVLMYVVGFPLLLSVVRAMKNRKR